MSNTLGCKEVDIEDADLSHEEYLLAQELLKTNTSGVVYSRVILFKDITDDELQSMYEYDANGPAFVMKIRPDWIKKYHPEIIQ